MSLFAACASQRPTTVPAPSGTFAAFAGEWRGAGTFQGRPSQVDARFEPLFSGDAWALDIKITTSAPTGEAMRFWGRAQYVFRGAVPTDGNWIDSTGALYRLTPRVENDALIVSWGDGVAVKGRSEYRVPADGTLRMEDFAPNRNGEMKLFAKARLERVRPRTEPKRR